MQLMSAVFSKGLLFLTAALLLFPTAGSAGADQDFRIAVMSARDGTFPRYCPLESYLKKRGLAVKFMATKGYRHATELFVRGEVEGLISGSGVAGKMILEKRGRPLVRPVSQRGVDSYRAVVVAPHGSPKFTENADYFRGKRVACCALAAAGEYYLRSVCPTLNSVQMLTTSSHEAAIAAVARGETDLAVVKDLVWKDLMVQYPGLTAVGSASGENPNETLLVSRDADPVQVEELRRILLMLDGDDGRDAALVREALNLYGYIPTTVADFQKTLAMLKKAGLAESGKTLPPGRSAQENR